MGIKETSAPTDAERVSAASEGGTAHSEPAELVGTESADDIIRLPAGSLAYDLVRTLRGLPYDKQREVMNFAQLLLGRQPPKRPGRSLAGMLAHLDVRISSEDIAEARKEMWGNFPREFPDE